MKQLSLLTPRFGSGFLDKHAGRLVRDPKIAIVELVANCWDAGADRVDIQWFQSSSPDIEIRDNGTGMTRQEFSDRWTELSYNRIQEQGVEVVFPDGNQSSARRAFGKNGKGRHAMFCFSDSYIVETTAGGWKITCEVSRSQDRDRPFSVRMISEEPGDEGVHGTALRTNCPEQPIPTDELRELIGSKFVSDPSFHVFVNGQEVELTDLADLVGTKTVTVPSLVRGSRIVIEEQIGGDHATSITPA